MLVASIDEKDSALLLGVEERQKLKEMEDQLIDVLLVLEATRDTIKTLLENYQQYCRDTSHRLEDGFDEGYDPIDCALQERERDIDSNRRKVETLYTKIQGTTNLVRDRLPELERILC